MDKKEELIARVIAETNSEKYPFKREDFDRLMTVVECTDCGNEGCNGFRATGKIRQQICDLMEVEPVFQSVKKFETLREVVAEAAKAKGMKILDTKVIHEDDCHFLISEGNLPCCCKPKIIGLTMNDVLNSAFGDSIRKLGGGVEVDVEGTADLTDIATRH